MKRVLFIDRDGTLIKEPPVDFQVDSLEKLVFYPGVFRFLSRIAAEMDYELVMVTNQDGLGTASFPEADFWPAQNKMLEALAGEGIVFSDIIIDRTMPAENAPTRKPGIGLMGKYLSGDYDLANSFVIGDRITDVGLAHNLGCKVIWMDDGSGKGTQAVNLTAAEIDTVTALRSQDWSAIYMFLKSGLRKATVIRNTNETKISVTVNMDGSGLSAISTGIGFFDHMLDQIARHGNIDLEIKAAGDLHIDEHHTIEDTGIALGEAFAKGLADKRGMQRYGFALPMDEASAEVLIDFGGRSWIVWDADFKREKIGEMPTEMFFHFFKSFSDAARCNLHIRCQGDNEHHKIEAIFKAFAKAIRMAIKRDPFSDHLPSTKGVL
jgi:imidazoleglycerol-phosphate dehydratase / histidinol-phosphatase